MNTLEAFILGAVLATIVVYVVVAVYLAPQKGQTTPSPSPPLDLSAAHLLADYRHLVERSEAWEAVCQVLTEAAPGWSDRPGTGLQCAETAIRELYVQACRNFPAIVPTGRWHELKTDPVHFAHLECGRKRAELRYDDRGYAVGDSLLLRETRYSSAEMEQGKPLEYTGRELSFVVSHKLAGLMMMGWCVLSLAHRRESKAQ